jgi:hypothetical protein
MSVPVMQDDSSPATPRSSGVGKPPATSIPPPTQYTSAPSSMGLVHAFAIQRLLLPGTDRDQYVASVHTLLGSMPRPPATGDG